jgi:hypothetical protein
MKKLVTNENAFILANFREILEQADIRCTIKNEFASSGSGELPHFDVWPELWILQDNDWERAKVILMEITDNSWENEWTCGFCDEKNADSFGYCWNCRNERFLVEDRLLSK